MQLVYGGYSFAVNEAEVQIARTTRRGEGGHPIGYNERWTVTGKLQGATQAAVNGAINALEAAFAVEDRDLSLYLDGGGLSEHHLDTSDSVGGTRVVEPPSFPEGRGGEFSTWRMFRVVVEADFLDAFLDVFFWTESLSFWGGGPQDKLWEPLAGLPIRQRVRLFTTYHATQTGNAIGKADYPDPPLPLWPGSEDIPARRIDKGFPKRAGPVGSPEYTEYPISWSYTFHEAVPLVGDPTAWPEI